MTDSTAVTEPPKVVDIVERYIALRQKKAELKATFDEAVKPIDAAMLRVETYLLGQMQDMGVDSVKTPFGTAYTTTKTSATVAEWSDVLTWVRENDQWEALTRGVSKDFVKTYRDEHNDLPPGVNWREERTVNIRKS